MKPQEWNSQNLTWQKVNSNLFKNFPHKVFFDIGVEQEFQNSSIQRVSLRCLFHSDIVINRDDVLPSGKLSAALAYSYYKVTTSELFGNLDITSGDRVYEQQFTELKEFETALAEV